MLIRLILGLWLAVSGLVAQAQRGPTTWATLEGTVVNALTQQPIAGALVKATPLSEQPSPTSSRTGPDGTFVLQLDPSRTYSIRTQATGFNELEEKLAFTDQRAERIYGKQIRLQPSRNLPDNRMPAVLPTIQFNPRQADLTPDAMNTLRQVAALLEAHPTVRIEAAGHTDTIGDVSLNRVLALERAEAVRTFLVQLGIPKNRIDVRSYGGTKPLPGPLTQERRAKNKRVELIINKQ